jgi:hypothetical protein
MKDWLCPIYQRFSNFEVSRGNKRNSTLARYLTRGCGKKVFEGMGKNPKMAILKWFN